MSLSIRYISLHRCVERGFTWQQVEYIRAQVSGVSCTAHPGREYQGAPEFKIPFWPSRVHSVFNKVGGWSIFHLTVC